MFIHRASLTCAHWPDVVDTIKTGAISFGWAPKANVRYARAESIKSLKVLKMKMPKENLIAQKSEYNDMTWNYAAAYQLSQNTNVQLHFQYKYYQHWY